MRIGEIETKNNVFLAPMAGVTDRAFREVCESFGSGLVCSEMVSAKGMYYGDKKTEELLKGKHSVPYSVQIFGSDPEIIGAVAARAAEYGDILDINMGCPMPKIVNNGDGSALLKNPSLAQRIVESAVKAVKKPVTAKMRIGWDKPEGYVDFAKALEAGGASAITVHGRTRFQFYTGEADWLAIAEIVKAVNIPVIGNGDVFSPESAKGLFDTSGCAAVSIGRGSRGNPFIFRSINRYLQTGEAENAADAAEKTECALRHVRRIVEYKGEQRGIKEARKHIAWYIKGMRGSAELKTKVFRATKYDEIENLMTEFYNRVYK